MSSARALSENLAVLLHREHDALAEFLVALADFDQRQAWRELGHASLFYFLHRELRLSKGAAQYRKVAAELIQAVPAVVEPLRDGRLCLTSIIEAAKVVTPGNWQSVLPRFYGLSKRDAIDVVAALQPHPAPPTRTLLTAAPVSASAKAAPPPDTASPAVTAPIPAPEPLQAFGWPCETPAVPAARPPEVVPLSADQRRLHVTVPARFARKLEEAQDARPDLSVEELLEAGLDLLLERAAKRKGLVEKPQEKLRPSKPDHVPAHVRREVWRRDGGRCQWKLASGELCGCTRGLQLDHIQPLARGGASTVDNVRLLCPAHNLEAALLVFGDELMSRYTGRRRTRSRRCA